MSDELTPITRKETFLAKAGGQNVVTPTPITREETFLQAIIDNGGGGGGGGGGGALIVNAVDDGEALVLDKTWNEIKAAYDSGMHIDGHYSVTEDYGMVLIFFGFYAQTSPDKYDVYFYDFTNTMVMTFTSNSATGYPALTE